MKQDPMNPFARLPDVGITRLKNLPEMLDCSLGTIINYVKRGILKKVRLGPNAVGVSNADLKALGEHMVRESCAITKSTVKSQSMTQPAVATGHVDLAPRWNGLRGEKK